MKRVFIDVREPEEYARGHVKGAINMPPSAFLHGATALKDMPKNTPIVVYCISGSRSNVAKHMLEDLGYTDIINGINKAQVESRYEL